jgi:hypothetical protein
VYFGSCRAGWTSSANNRNRHRTRTSGWRIDGFTHLGAGSDNVAELPHRWLHALGAGSDNVAELRKTARGHRGLGADHARPQLRLGAISHNFGWALFRKAGGEECSFDHMLAALDSADDTASPLGPVENAACAPPPIAGRPDYV